MPEGLKLLMNMCWNQRPINRPSFQQISKHLDVSEPEITLFEQEQEYAELTRAWSIEINEQLARLPSIDFSSTLEMSNDDLIKKRKEELQHIADIRAHYQAKLQQVNTIYIELSSMMMQLQKREQEIKKKERFLDIHHQQSSSSNKTSGKKRTMQAISDARRKSLQLIKAASLHLNDPMMISSQLSAKRGFAMQTNSGCRSNSSETGFDWFPDDVKNLYSIVKERDSVLDRKATFTSEQTAKFLRSPVGLSLMRHSAENSVCLCHAHPLASRTVCRSLS